MNTVFLAYLILISLGIAWRFIPGVTSPLIMRNAISSLVIQILLPLLTISVIAKAPMTDAIWQIPVTAIFVTIGCLLITWLVYAGLRKTFLNTMSDATLGSLIIGSTWCNATYLGLPIISGIFGEEFSFIPVLYDVLALTPLLWTVGVFTAGYYRGDEKSHGERIRESLMRILRLPPVYAVIIGLSLKYSSLQVPEMILYVSEIAGKAVPPIMMISVGMALTLPKWKSLLILIPGSIIRLFIAPILASVCIVFFGIHGTIGEALIIESGMPTMVLTLALIDMYELDAEILSHLIAFTTISSFITLQFHLLS
jgi:predicted permease